MNPFPHIPGIAAMLVAFSAIANCHLAVMAETLPEQPRPDPQPQRVFNLEPRTWVAALAFSPDGSLLACGGHQVRDNKVVGYIQIWDVATGQPRRSWLNSEGVAALAFSPDGSTLASGGGGMLSPNPPGTIRLWDARTGGLKQTLPGHLLEVGQMQFSADRNLLASSARYNKEVRLWDLRTGTLQRTILFDQEATVNFALALSSQAAAPQRLMVVATDYIEGEWDHDIRKPGTGTADVWDVATGQLQRRLMAEKSHVREVALASDGHLAAGASGLNPNTTVRVWDAQTGQVLHVLPVPEGEFVRFLQYAPDNTTLVSANSYSVVSPTDAQTWKWRVRLWNVKTGKLRKTLEQELERSDWIRSMAVSPDSKILATSSDGDSIKLWELK